MSEFSTRDTATRSALIKGAAEIFAESGYQLARVRDIAARAGANLAAVNYHFGSKEGLYLAVLEALAGDMVRQFPVAEPAVAGRPAKERLRAGIRNLLARFMGESDRALLPRLLVREFANPTPALEQIIQHFAKPQIAQMSAIVAELLGPEAKPEQVRLAALSTGSQCLFYLLARPLASRIDPGVYKEGGLERLVDHITEFSLGALSGMRRRRRQEAP